MEIEDEDLLYRRLARHQVNPDGTVNSSAFKRGKGYDHEISVDVARLTSRQESIDRAPVQDSSLAGSRPNIRENWALVLCILR
jgi:hypothetical protein